MTYEEIKAQLSALVKAMEGKSLTAPSASFDMSSDADDRVWLHAEELKPRGYSVFRGEDALSRAMEFIAELPDPEIAVKNEYMRRVADVVDYGKDKGIDDEYLEPLRGVNVAISENLLTKE